MSKLQAIENGLISINDAVFQELCDKFLVLKNRNYLAFSRVGSKTGKQKTISGTPDSLFLLPNGLYMFVEHSTNITLGSKKIEADILKCLDSNSTGIDVQLIEEIIICINFNLKPQEIEHLRSLLKHTSIRLQIYTLADLALQLDIHHRDLAHEYLGLSLDSGQIVSIDTFIKRYNESSSAIATPLTNEFFHRQVELANLNSAIKDFDFIILTGAAGIGKTRIALEAIKDFLRQNFNYKGYCISNNHSPLIYDLHHYLQDGDNILFCDDANRIDTINQVIEFYRTARKGRLKIVLTVRDYAFHEVSILCNDFRFKKIDLFKLDDDQILDIITSASFNITNRDYQDVISRIANGNPRLAIMCAKLALATQDITRLYDVSELFEEYFKTFIKDGGEFADKDNLRCLGLIGFFYSLPYKNRDIMIPILGNFDTTYEKFIDAIDRLDKLELVEIQFEYVKIPEQNLSTFFFYKAFIKDDLLSFDILLEKYFTENVNRFRDTIIPSNNTFGHTNVQEKLKPKIKDYWNKINVSEDKAFQFLDIFWFILQNETLEYFTNKINALPPSFSHEFEVPEQRNNNFKPKDKIIDILSTFFNHPPLLEEPLVLSFEYVRKKPDKFPDLISRINEVLAFDYDDRNWGYKSQYDLFKYLIKGVENNDWLLTKAFFILSKSFLAFQFRHTKSARGDRISIYEYKLPFIEEVKHFREKLWTTIDKFFEKYPDLAFDTLSNYARIHPDVSSEMMNYDIHFVVQIIKNHLKQESFEHCKYVQDQIAWCKRHDVTHEAFPILKQHFVNDLYKLFLIIDWDMHSYLLEHKINHRDYEKIKENEIRNYFHFRDIFEIKSFFNDFVYLRRRAKNSWSYNNTLDLIIDQTSQYDFKLALYFINEIIEEGNSIGYTPARLFVHHLNTNANANLIWNIISKDDFKYKQEWKLNFFHTLNDSIVSSIYVSDLILTFKELNEAEIIHFERFEKFLKVDPDLFRKLLEIIVEKNISQEAKLHIWIDFFEKYLDFVNNDLTLIKRAYLQQDKIQNHFDYQNQGFLNILKKDVSFLYEYVKDALIEDGYRIRDDHKDLSFVWELNKIEIQLEKVFNLLGSEGHFFGISQHYCNAFFRTLDEEKKQRAADFLRNYVVKCHKFPRRINIVVDIVRNTMTEYFEEILILYLRYNLNVDDFKHIYWRGNGGTYSGNVIIGDIEATQWQNILAMIDKYALGFKINPIRHYVQKQVDYGLERGEQERQWRFIENR